MVFNVFCSADVKSPQADKIQADKMQADKIQANKIQANKIQIFYGGEQSPLLYFEQSPPLYFGY